jgi:TetR/AcrR family transcriptional regulator, lmrAB and yxaGH operons repressor
MVEAGATLFQRKGFHGVGLAEILELSKAPKGSFYYYFPDGKEQLAEATIQRAGDAVGGMIDAAFKNKNDFKSGAEKLVRLISEWFEKSDFSEGCPITSILLETVPKSDRLARASKTAFDLWICKTEQHCQRLGLGENSHEVATALLVALEGAWILARAQRSKYPFTVTAGLVSAFARSFQQ